MLLNYRKNGFLRSLSIPAYEEIDYFIDVLVHELIH